ncbi:DUF423 domain-containing protein [Lacihabitans soyangensis]|uniref:DUF423 domain-containing protein n=1 Tax=Lacihabitans soyangensis TaxID=869394 RepID=A0AAE3GZ37_9BACT|nr:DUF423 domain-containing protein [Lacihabitans soyangensis]MCP9761908.1 DUF423 domain-containing protein [Lacihabitans soyangensis]
MNKFFLLSGSVLGLLGVAIGAFGAHALKAMLESSGRSDTFETGVRYMFYHAIALVLVGILSKEFPGNTINWSGNAFLLGTLIFSGSLFLICFTGINVFGAVAPIGGTLLVIGWGLLFWSVLKG